MKRFLILISALMIVCLLNAEEIQLNEVSYTENQIQEKFYPIGFERNKFAYIKHIYEEGIGSYYWQFNVMNMTTNEILKTEKILSIDSSDSDIPSKFVNDSKKFLKNAGVAIENNATIAPLPVTIGNEIYNAYLESVSKTENDGIVVEKEAVQFSKNNKLVKTIGEVNTLTFFGQKKYYDFKIVGFLKNGDELLILVSYKRQEDEESKIITGFKLFWSKI